MKKVAEQQPAMNLLEISKTLKELGFDLHLLGSMKYLLARLNGLGPNQASKLKDVFIKNNHLRFKQFASGKHLPFGRSSDYTLFVRNADATEIAKLIKIFAMLLLQVKVYLFSAVSWNGN